MCVNLQPPLHHITFFQLHCLSNIPFTSSTDTHSGHKDMCVNLQPPLHHITFLPAPLSLQYSLHIFHRHSLWSQRYVCQPTASTSSHLSSSSTVSPIFPSHLPPTLTLVTKICVSTYSLHFITFVPAPLSLQYSLHIFHRHSLWSQRYVCQPTASTSSHNLSSSSTVSPIFPSHLPPALHKDMCVNLQPPLHHITFPSSTVSSIFHSHLPPTLTLVTKICVSTYSLHFIT